MDSCPASALNPGYLLELIELDTGGYGLIEAKVLKAAPAVTAKKGFNPEEMKALHTSKIRIADFENEIMDGVDMLGEDA